MDNQNGARTWRYGFRDFFRVDVKCVWIDIRKDWLGAERTDGAASRHERKWRKNDFVAGLNPRRSQSKNQRVGSRCRSYAMLHATERGDFSFQCRAFFSQDKLLGSQHLIDSFAN